MKKETSTPIYLKIYNTAKEKQSLLLGVLLLVLSVTLTVSVFVDASYYEGAHSKESCEVIN